MADNYIERLKQRQEAATGEPEAWEPRPELPTDPEVRAEWLQDELTNTREQLAKEKAARQQAERRAEQQARPTSFGDFLRAKQVSKRRTWR
jgi:hypothetical protein